MEVLLTIIKVLIILFLLCPCEHRVSFQNKSVSSAFNWMSMFIVFLTKQNGTGRYFFWRLQEWGPHCEIIRKSTWLLWEMKSFCFSKTRNNPSLPLLFNMYCKAWSFMIILWIDSRTCQKNTLVTIRNV